MTADPFAQAEAAKEIRKQEINLKIAIANKKLEPVFALLLEHATSRNISTLYFALYAAIRFR